MGKIVIPGEPEPKQNNGLLSTELYRRYAEQVLESKLAFLQMLRIAELRKSCGVESKAGATVEVNLPPRYLMEAKDGQ